MEAVPHAAPKRREMQDRTPNQSASHTEKGGKRHVPSASLALGATVRRLFGVYTRVSGRRGRTLLLVTLMVGSTAAGMAAPNLRDLDHTGIVVPRDLRSVVDHGLRASPSFLALFDYLNASASSKG